MEPKRRNSRFVLVFLVLVFLGILSYVYLSRTAVDPVEEQAEESERLQPDRPNTTPVN